MRNAARIALRRATTAPLRSAGSSWPPELPPVLGGVRCAWRRADDDSGERKLLREGKLLQLLAGERLTFLLAAPPPSKPPPPRPPPPPTTADARLTRTEGVGSR